MIENEKEIYNRAIADVESEIADLYDQFLKKNSINTKRNFSGLTLKLRERINKLKQ